MRLILIVVVVVIVIAMLRRRRRDGQLAASAAPVIGGSVVTVGDIGVTHRLANGQSESVRWDDLDEVAVVTNDQGPFADDVHWLLLPSGRQQVCAIPQSALGSDKLLEHLQQLPGFRNETFVESMGSTTSARFVVWKRGEEL
jgi:hypothetical protein